MHVHIFHTWKLYNKSTLVCLQEAVQQPKEATLKAEKVVRAYCIPQRCESFAELAFYHLEGIYFSPHCKIAGARSVSRFSRSDHIHNYTCIQIHTWYLLPHCQSHKHKFIEHVPCNRVTYSSTCTSCSTYMYVHVCTCIYTCSIYSIYVTRKYMYMYM